MYKRRVLDTVLQSSKHRQMSQTGVPGLVWLAFFLCGYGASAFESEDTEITPQKTFKAAVYEHAVVLPSERTIAVSRATALANMMRNLETYREQAELAGSMAVDILVFPEDGIYGMIMTREAIKPYLEFIPDPKVENWCPCTAPSRFPDSEVQQYLSCLARNNSFYLVANFGDIQPCDGTTDQGCPTDGHYQFNTDIVYDKTGTLVARYHKETLYGEPQFDKPPVTEYIYFDTPFGRFGVFTCFDILFHDPAVSLVTKYNVTNIVFPTAWIDALPFLAAIQFHSAFAAGSGVNLLAANIHIPSFGFHGSGIYTPNGALRYYYNDKTNDSRLLTSKVRVLGDNSATESQFNVSIRRDIYTFMALADKQGHLTVCQRSLCCHLEYAGKSTSERFAFGVLDNLHMSGGSRNYYLQICALLKCASNETNTCEPPTKYSETTFSKINIKGNFSTQTVFPEMLLADGDGLALSKIGDWKFQNNELEIKRVKRPLISASLLGRIYDYDTFNYH